jgi:hypothetical protein
MLGKLSVALLLAAAPAVAAEPASDIKVDESGQAYKIKKICRTVEVAGSFIPRRSCVNKKIPVTKPVAEAPADGAGASGGADNSAPQQEQEEQ